MAKDAEDAAAELNASTPREGSPADSPRPKDEDEEEQEGDQEDPEEKGSEGLEREASQATPG